MDLRQQDVTLREMHFRSQHRQDESERQQTHRYALEVYQEGAWRDRHRSWADYITEVLGDSGDANGIYILRWGTPVLAKLKDNPFTCNGITIDDTTFGAGRSSHLQEILPDVRFLDLKTPESITLFRECMGAAGTMTREELRNWRHRKTVLREPAASQQAPDICAREDTRTAEASADESRPAGFVVVLWQMGHNFRARLSGIRLRGRLRRALAHIRKS